MAASRFTRSMVRAAEEGSQTVVAGCRWRCERAGRGRMIGAPERVVPAVPSRVREFEKHLRALDVCRSCPNVFGDPVVGAVWGAKVMLVGQAPGSREVVDRRPFAWTAGTKLFSWFAKLGIDERTFRSRVHIAAVIRCFPGKNPKGGGDRVPDPVEIAHCGEHLDREIRLLEPELVIAVGTLAAQQMLGNSVLTETVGRLHRGERAGRSFDVVVLPHPSGRSTWLNREENRQLLERSLWLIAQHPAFVETFRGRKRRAG